MRKLADLSALPGGIARGFRARGGTVILVRHGNEVSAFRDACPHLGLDLAWNPDAYMDVDNEYIQCATHGALFEPTTGECVFGPCIGDRLGAVAIEIKDDAVWIDG
ncbi:Rieske 2Fe-2S domain-containing protein [Litorivicinus lipolyticus]|uniref:Rieske 2Fe-2S domain-containing protein n=1 Tax=Litorivicinus lipolyticus TaxID=418701 RepID=A0A5Q2QFB8_9GAMM|nr:Rieske (2Fe-2S) protein [Litorivicinus lipolyticus]QGG81061.1 Rieske 2Fe-2S domain-containing protein [Litorivicinus lipolyticus]